MKVDAGTDRDVFREVLARYWGYASFRGVQEDIILSIARGHDTLGLMPTGGGKSVTFQVPALTMEGVCVVVTPLIALMKDQVQHLRRRGITATAVYAGMERADVVQQLENCVHGGCKFLYVSPERLGTELFQTKLRHMKVSFITVDEAHCISQWGYDFRPAYLEIARIRDVVPEAPVLALTASATPRVAEDVRRQLRFRADSEFHKMSFARDNLTYVVRRAEDKMAELVHILRSVPGSAIVYVRSRQGSREMAQALEAEGITALYYHAGLSPLDKDVRQQAWQRGEVRVMVATNAFGMGIDKADVRLVLHADVPDSVEAYFQEAGRAGRDGRRAYAVLVCNGRDTAKLRKRVPDNFPDKDYIRRVYERLAFYFELAMGDGCGMQRDFNVEEFCRRYKYFPNQALSALRILASAGYIDFRESEEMKSRVLFLVPRDELYRLRFLEPGADRVMQGLLRVYGGLFSDYVYIDEGDVAASTGLQPGEVYQTLKELNRMRILHYIPRKSTPRIRYVQRREPADELVLSREVYDDRRKEYEERVESMLAYVNGRDVCRSEFLLRYFGDETARPCGHCDVCLARQAEKKDHRAIADALLYVLNDGKPHAPADLRLTGIAPADSAEALEQLVHDGKVVLRDGLFQRVERARKAR